MSRQSFDLETGVPEIDMIEQAHAQQSMVTLAEARAIADMTRTKGWAIVSEFLCGSVERNKERLIDEVDVDKVRRLQERTKAFLQVIGFVGSQVTEASHEASQLEDQEASDDSQPDPDEGPDNQE